MRLSPIVLAAVSLFASILVPRQGLCDSFTASYLAAGAQTPGSLTNYVNTFESATYNSTTKTTTFNNSTIIGTYSGTFSLSGANQYGGAGGVGNFITTSNSYTLSLSTGANYFGLWFSALDAGNQLQFYRDTTLLYTFTPALYQQLVGACPNSSNAYCGNPNSAYLGMDNGEQFAYLNFYDNSGLFNKVVFTQINSGGGFESDNQAVALITSTPTSSQLGTAIVTPEPSTWVLGLTGMGVVATALAFKRYRSV